MSKNKQARVPFHKTQGEGGIKRFLGNVQIHGPLFKTGPHKRRTKSFQVFLETFSQENMRMILNLSARRSPNIKLIQTYNPGGVLQRTGSDARGSLLGGEETVHHHCDHDCHHDHPHDHPTIILMIILMIITLIVIIRWWGNSWRWPACAWRSWRTSSPTWRPGAPPQNGI